MKCRHCGIAIHKCASADEYHADDPVLYRRELDGSGCIHEPDDLTDAIDAHRQNNAAVLAQSAVTKKRTSPA